MAITFTWMHTLNFVPCNFSRLGWWVLYLGKWIWEGGIHSCSSLSVENCAFYGHHWLNRWTIIDTHKQNRCIHSAHKVEQVLLLFSAFTCRVSRKVKINYDKILLTNERQCEPNRECFVWILHTKVMKDQINTSGCITIVDVIDTCLRLLTGLSLKT